MKLPVEIRFVGMENSPALERAARDKITHIERHAADVIAWRVTIEQPHRHQQQGRLFAVKVDVTLTGQELVVDRIEREDPWVALHDAFDAVARRIDDVLRIRRGEVKGHSL